MSLLPAPLRALGLALALAGGGAAAAAPGAPGAPLAPDEIRQELRSFRVLGSVLHVGAHPDDENTELLTWLSRGRGLRTAYLSLTRGDGGQNELGGDFDAKLGLLRTQELLAARAVDHGRQFFTRAIDFGYSKTPEESLRLWERNEVLGDMVRVLRQFRPDVIVTRFPVPPGSGGHGQHSASAVLALDAFKLAGDAAAYPEQLGQGLAPWQPRRIVWNAFRQPAGAGLNGPEIQIDITGADPVTGESFDVIAARSRAMHKTQGLGAFPARAGSGPNLQRFILLAGAAPRGDLLDDVDLSWNRVPGGASIAPLADELLARFRPEDPAASVPALLLLRKRLAELPTDPLVMDKQAQLDRILAACLGLSVQTLVDQAEVVGGERVVLHYRVSHQAPGVKVRHVQTRSPTLGAMSAGAGAMLPANQAARGDLAGVLPVDTPPSQPYWLRAPGSAGIARVDDSSLIGQAENPPAIRVEHEFSVNGQTLVLADEPVQWLADAPPAQQRRRVDVVRPVSLRLDSAVMLFAPGTTRPVEVEVTSARAGLQGSLRLALPPGWKAEPSTQPLRLTASGDRVRVAFRVTTPAQPSAGELTAVAEVNGQTFSAQRQELRYGHLPVQLLQAPASARVVSFELATRGARVGYLAGAGDQVPESLVQMGYSVRQLSGADLSPERLAGLDAVVIGVRAFNERTDLADHLAGLLAWVEAGGTVIAQYNRPGGLKTSRLGPYALSLDGPAPALRVTDENSPVTLLASEHAALNRPNKIGPADFEGWVQERGAYFPSAWDRQHYVALLAMNDPGEAPLESSLLVAALGKGHYVYTGIGFFRQLPAGVPGAYRLFANLLALGS